MVDFFSALLHGPVVGSRSPLLWLQIAAGVSVAVACGARTGLLVPEPMDASDVVVAERDAREEDVREEDAFTFADVAPDAQCPAEATLIYITGEGNQLWSFWPPAFQFTLIGTLNCLSGPTHMTVDRNGNAWVVAGGFIYRASTTDATCQQLPTWTTQTGFDDFALTFVGLTNTDTTLYLLSMTDLARFDIVMGTFTIIGAPNVPFSYGGDMTSNGDGNLYFLHDTTPRDLDELNPLNAQVINTYIVAAGAGDHDQALAYFGGLFYAFVNGVVYSYDVATMTTTMLGNAPISVTGAGQSTCVPTSPTDAGAPDVSMPD